MRRIGHHPLGWQPCLCMPNKKKTVSLGRNWSTSEETISGILFGYGSIPINTIFSGMNIHLPAILMWTTGVQGFDPSPFLGFYLKAVIPVELRRYTVRPRSTTDSAWSLPRWSTGRLGWPGLEFLRVSGDLTWATRKPSWNCGFGWRLRSSFRDYMYIYIYTYVYVYIYMYIIYMYIIYIISSFCWSCHIFLSLKVFFWLIVQAPILTAFL